MIEIRIHGRGGQGAVIASQILAEAAFRQGLHVQAFPSFGSERRGAPVTAFLRLDHSAVTIRSEVYRPDGVVILDPSFITLRLANVFEGLKPAGWVLINSPQRMPEFDVLHGFSVATVDAAGIARRHGLGTATAPIVNTVITGAIVAFTEIASLDNLAAAIGGIVPVKPEENVAAALEGAQALHRWPPAELRRHAHGRA